MNVAKTITINVTHYVNSIQTILVWPILCPKIQKQKHPKTCKCGGTTHLRTTYRFCPKNKRFAQNSQANQTNTLDEYIHILNNQITVIPPDILQPLYLITNTQIDENKITDEIFISKTNLIQTHTVNKTVNVEDNTDTHEFLV